MTLKSNNVISDVQSYTKQVFTTIHPYAKDGRLKPIPLSLSARVQVPVIGNDGLMYVTFESEFATNYSTNVLELLDEYIKGMGYMGYELYMNFSEVKEYDAFDRIPLRKTILLKVDLIFHFPISKRVTRPSMRILLEGRNAYN